MDIYGASDRNSLLKKQRITWDRFFYGTTFHWDIIWSPQMD